MTILQREQLEQLVAGTAFLGSGGGGSIHAGQMFIEAIVANGGVQLTQVAPEGLGCVVADIGANSAFSPDQVQALSNCLKLMGNQLNGQGKGPVKCLFPVETGPENTLAPMMLASSLGIPVFDGDGAGRAVPEIQLCTYAATGISPSPLALANGQQDGVIAFAADAADMDRMLRPLTAAPQFGDSASMALFADGCQNLAAGSVSGTVTLALALGRMLELLSKGQPVPPKITEAVNLRKGCILAEGSVLAVEDSVAGDFDMGRVTISDVRTRGRVTVYTQNENLLAYSRLSNSPLACAPHSICYLKSDLTALTNAEIKKNDRVWLMAVEAVPEISTPTMLEGFSKVLADIGYAGEPSALPYSELQPLGTLLQSLMAAKA